MHKKAAKMTEKAPFKRACKFVLTVLFSLYVIYIGHPAGVYFVIIDRADHFHCQNHLDCGPI
jgi:hypothetical protein